MGNIKTQPNRICDIVDREKEGFILKTNGDPKAFKEFIDHKVRRHLTYEKLAAILGNRTRGSYYATYIPKLAMHKGG